ncbi:hypothetical protein [Lacibacter sp. H407]|uniref:hypothetical protein n=1 Tax=Lacibacter sp. H407 TaxID=3133423 RepID=UPI0030C58337
MIVEFPDGQYVPKVPLFLLLSVTQLLVSITVFTHCGNNYEDARRIAGKDELK